MDYARTYIDLVSRARDRVLEGYSEKHHVVPKCMGGTNDPHNLVRLTPEEHYVAHQLLVKLNPDHRGLIFALLALSMNKSGRMNNKKFGWIRRRLGEEIGNRKRGVPRPPHIGEAVRRSNLTRTASVETRARMSAALRGRPKSAEHNAKVSAALMGRPGTRLGHTNSAEHREKQSRAALKRKGGVEHLAMMQDKARSMTPEQRSARAHKAWETKRRKATELAATITTTKENHDD